MSHPEFFSICKTLYAVKTVAEGDGDCVTITFSNGFYGMYRQKLVEDEPLTPSTAHPQPVSVTFEKWGMTHHG